MTRRKLVLWWPWTSLQTAISCTFRTWKRWADTSSICGAARGWDAARRPAKSVPQSPKRVSTANCSSGVGSSPGSRLLAVQRTETRRFDMDDQVAVVMGIDPGTLVRPLISPSFSYAHLSISLRLNNILTVRDRPAFITVSEDRALIDSGGNQEKSKQKNNTSSSGTKMRERYYFRRKVLINMKEINTSVISQRTYLESILIYHVRLTDCW